MQVLLNLSIIATRSFRPPLISMAAIHTALAGSAIKPIATLEHQHANSPQAWRDALAANPGSPKDFQLIKTLVYKPKTAKAATPIPVVVIARDETETSSSAIGKALGQKELRLASEDLLTEFFALDKNSRAY